MLRFAAVSLAVVFMLGINFLITDAALSPIFVITGYGGSQLHVRDDSNTNCNTGGETIRVWLNRTHITGASQCFINQMMLNYTSDGRYLDAQDVTVSTVNFGNLSSFADFSELFPPSNSDDAESIIDYFLDRGYTVDKNIRAAPYDWRLGAVQLRARGYYDNLRRLTEDMYRENGNTKVTLVVISMGGPVSHYFLTQVVNQEWKDTYIHSYISLGAAWSGASSVAWVLTPPPTRTFFFFIPVQASTQDLRSLTQSFASSYWLLPRASAFGDTILVSTPSRNYTASDYQELFNDAGFSEGYARASQNSNDFPAPNVATYCFYGLGFPTPLTYIYDNGFPNTQPSIVYGEGDNTVNKESLEVCNQWANSGYPFNRTIFPGVNHLDIINHRAAVQAIGRVVGAPADPINGVKPLATLQCLYAIIFISMIYMML